MADNRTDSFVFFHSYYNSIMSLKDDKAKVELLKCICLYAYNGEFHESEIDYVNAIFESHRFNIDKSIENRITNQKNGSKGGAPQGNQNARKQPKTTENNRTDEENNLNGDVDVNADADGDSYGDWYVNLNEYVDEHADGKENGIVKGKRKGRGGIKNLKVSELDNLFPTEDINLVSDYYTKLKRNDFISASTNESIKTLEDMKKDFESYKRSNQP